MFAFDSDSLRALAKLARVACTEEELSLLHNHLQKILKMVESLQKVDTDDVPPCNHVFEEATISLREDDPMSELDRDAFLQNSPSHVGGMVRIPPVM